MRASRGSLQISADAAMGVDYSDRQCADFVVRLGGDVTEALGRLVAHADPEVLYDPVRYVIAGEGKHIRPVLLLLSAGLFGVDTAHAMPAALAVELTHDFALVHDDIMDNADSRRGRASVHVRWDEDIAILCGDVLLSMSFDLVARTSSPHVPLMVRMFAAMVAALCEGQALDKAFEKRKQVTPAQYLDMIDRKTGALVSAALELGGMIGGASSTQREALWSMGREAGRAFQIQDDLLDLVAEDVHWGKPIGGDLMEGKKTFLLLEALARSAGGDYAFFSRIRRGAGLPPEEIPEARSRLEGLGVIELARERVRRHSAAAAAYVEHLPRGVAASALAWTIHDMAARVR